MEKKVKLTQTIKRKLKGSKRACPGERRRRRKKIKQKRKRNMQTRS